LEQRLVLDTPYRDHGFRERFKKPIHEIFNRIMNHAATDDDETENKEDGKQQVNDEKQPSAKKKASGE
jgi:hypothetical protein